jgi:glutathione S-transferase
MLKIWGRANAPNVQKVLWGCEELGLAYQRVDPDGPHAGIDKQSYLKINPNGLVPTLEDGDFILWESHAILRYLAARRSGGALYPTDPRLRAIVDQWLDWQAAHQAHVVRGLVKLFRRPGEDASKAVDEARYLAEPLFVILDERLRQAAFVAGPTFTLADIPNAIGARRWLSLPIERPALPALEEWVARTSARPAFQRLVATLAAASRAP